MQYAIEYCIDNNKVCFILCFFLLGAVDRCPELEVIETRLPVDTPFWCNAKLSTSIEIFKLHKKYRAECKAMHAMHSLQSEPPSPGNLGNI